MYAKILTDQSLLLSPLNNCLLISYIYFFGFLIVPVIFSRVPVEKPTGSLIFYHFVACRPVAGQGP
jgi:hypothetical protein